MLTLAHRVAGQRVRNRRGNSTHSAVPAGSLPFERHVIPPRVAIRRAFSVRDSPVALYSYYLASIGKWLGQKCVRNESNSSRTIGLLLPLETVSTLGMRECCRSRQLLVTRSQPSHFSFSTSVLATTRRRYHAARVQHHRCIKKEHTCVCFRPRSQMRFFLATHPALNCSPGIAHLGYADMVL
jgi:hypothetical protein